MWKKLLKYLRERNCENNKHKWKHFKTKSKNFYYLRKCLHCKYTEVQSAGPAGVNEWTSILKIFRWDWEDKDFRCSLKNLKRIE